MHEYTIDREKYGLPCGDADPVYTAVKWPLTKNMQHCRNAMKQLGPHVADLFAVGVADAGSVFDRFSRVAAGGYLASFIEAFADIDLVDSFKRMASDGKLKRTGRDGLAMVYEDTDAGRAMATNDLVNGLEHYYSGRVDEIAALWWAMLCENCAPFASLHGRIAAVLRPTKPAPSPTH